MKRFMCIWYTDVNVNVMAVSAGLPKGEARRLAPTLMEHMRQCDEILMIKGDRFDTNHNHRPDNELNLTALAAFASSLEQTIAATPIAISAHWTEQLEVYEGKIDRSEFT